MTREDKQVKAVAVLSEKMANGIARYMAAGLDDETAVLTSIAIAIVELH